MIALLGGLVGLAGIASGVKSMRNQKKIEAETEKVKKQIAKAKRGER